MQCEIGLCFPGTAGKSLLLLLVGFPQAARQSPAGTKSTVVLTHLVSTGLKQGEGKRILNMSWEQFVLGPCSQSLKIQSCRYKTWEGSSPSCRWLGCPKATEDWWRSGGTFSKHLVPQSLLNLASTAHNCLSTSEDLEWKAHSVSPRAKTSSSEACSKPWISFSWVTSALDHN